MQLIVPMRKPVHSKDYTSLYLLIDIPIVLSLFILNDWGFFFSLTFIASPVLLMVLYFKFRVKLSRRICGLFQFMARTFFVLTVVYFYFRFNEFYTLHDLVRPPTANEMEITDQDAIFALSLVGFMMLVIWTSIANIIKHTFKFFRKPHIQNLAKV